MKMLLLVPSMVPGGAQRQVVNLARGMAKRDVEVHLVTLAAGGRLEAEVACDERVHTHSLGRCSTWDILRPAWRLRRLLVRQRFDVVYSFLAVPNILSLVARTLGGRPKVVWGIRTALVDYPWDKRTSALAAQVEALLAPLADCVIANSQAGTALWRRKLGSCNKLGYVANGIDTQLFIVEPWIRNAARSELGFDDAEEVIGIVGTLSPMKDHGTFLEAAALLSRRLPSARFLCVGGEEPGMEHYALAMRHRASELGLKGIVQWLGDRSDVPRLIAALDLLTSSSRREGSSNVIAEGMACGVPCVVTNVGDSADIVGDTGIVVRPGQPKALADAWVRTLALSAEDRRSIGARARRRVEKCFSVDRMVDETLRVLQQVVSE